MYRVILVYEDIYQAYVLTNYQQVVQTPRWCRPFSDESVYSTREVFTHVELCGRLANLQRQCT